MPNLCSLAIFHIKQVLFFRSWVSTGILRQLWFSLGVQDCLESFVSSAHEMCMNAFIIPLTWSGNRKDSCIVFRREASGRKRSSYITDETLISYLSARKSYFVLYYCVTLASSFHLKRIPESKPHVAVKACVQKDLVYEITDLCNFLRVVTWILLVLWLWIGYDFEFCI